MKPVDFMQTKKNAMPVTMPGGRKLLVLPPKKKLFDTLAALMQEEKQDTKAVYALAAEVLSNNRQGVRIVAADLEQLDITDIKHLFNAYVSFIKEELSRPN